MGNENRSYRIRANVNRDSVLNFNMTQTYDKFDILSLTLDQKNAYRLMESDTGVIAGRVLANGGFGVPNAKISVFIEYEDTDDIHKRLMYNYSSTQDLDSDGIRYNLLSEVDEACHQNVGTFPTKRILLDNKDWIEIFDKYYKYTTRTNNAGDYMIYGVPTGMQKVHMDVDLSDIGVLSQTPRDMMYKGYNADLFDSPTKFKKDTNLLSLVQIVSQDNDVYVYPFWGDTTNSTTNAAITRCDINISYKFEPTCIFMGSVISDTGEDALSKKCIAAKEQGKMSELMTGEGRIEMIRKTYDNKVESYSVKGDKVIDENGVWCYQIPMNLDYVVTDEFGNTVLSDNPDLGIPTRTRVRFRLSMSGAESDSTARKRARYLIPNNPRMVEDDYPNFYKTQEIDYEFGSKTKDENFRDLMWNNVYTVKNYIPRLQKSKLPNNLRHTGIKMVNHSGANNPMPYNNLRIKFNFTYRFLCIIAKIIITIVRLINTILTGIAAGFYNLGILFIQIANSNAVTEKLGRWFAKIKSKRGGDDWKTPGNAGYPELDDDSKIGNKTAAENAGVYMLQKLCTTMVKDGKKDSWNFNVDKAGIGGIAAFFLVIAFSIGCGITLNGMCETDDGEEIDVSPGTNDTIKKAFSKAGCTSCDDNVAKLYNCIENQLAQDNEVTSFNFYNDWVNGVVYLPLWYRKIKPKKNFLGIKIKAKDQFCSTDTMKKRYKKKIKLFNTMVPKRTINAGGSVNPMGNIAALEDDAPTVEAKADDETGAEIIKFSQKIEKNCYGYDCHNKVRAYQMVKTGFIKEKETMLGDLVQYYRPTYFDNTRNSDLVTLFATDIVLLGSLNSCDLHGIPQFFKALESTTYNMPPDLMAEDYEYNNDNVPSDYTDEKDSNDIDKSSRYTEYTGADWGNLGGDQSNYDKVVFTNPFSGTKYTSNANENQYDNGGLFYGLTCSDSYTKPKSCINLVRICEFGVSLDESQDILNTSMVTDTTTEDDLENDYSTLTPDGFVSYDEIYNPDYRSMFATMNANFLKTKLNYETGLTEYDFTHLYLDNFDGSMNKLMQAKTVNGLTEKSNFTEKANYIGNYNLERSSDAYLNFRFGNYTKLNNKKIYYYDYNMKVSANTYSGDRMPRYENSFYFYFGLNEGKTAIDKFNTDYFSECSQKDIVEAAYDINHLGNSWCPVDSDDGYVAFTTTMETPISVVFSEANNPEQTYSVSGIQKNNFYIGTKPAGELVGYAKYTLTDDMTGISDIKILPKNCKYNVTITDGDGIDYKDSIDFKAESLTYTDDIRSFSCKNAELDEMFAVTGSDGQLDWRTMFTNIANYGEIPALSVNINRNIHGYINIKNVSVSNYSISITPANQSFFDDEDGNHLYEGVSIIVENNAFVSKSGEGYIGKAIGGWYFGVPYGEQRYCITITQRCQNEDGTWVDTGNSVTDVVSVPEGMFKMYINGIDYDNIKNFRTGWRKNLTGYERKDDTNIFDSTLIYGWDNLDNIGKYCPNPLSVPAQMLDIDTVSYDTLTDNTTKVAAIGSVLSSEYGGNGTTYYPIRGQLIDFSNPYTWSNTYCYASESWSTDMQNMLSGNKITDTSSNTEIDVTRTDTITPVLGGDYTYEAQYTTSGGVVAATEDTSGTITYAEGYTDLTGITFYDYRMIIDNINEIIEARREFVKELKGALRIGYEETTLNITFKSNETPVKFLITGNEETLINPAPFASGGGLNSFTPTTGSKTNYYVGNKKVFDLNLEETSVQFHLPTLTYDETTMTWIPFEKPQVTTQDYQKHPYYVALKDNNGSCLPAKSNTQAMAGTFQIAIDNFSNQTKSNPYLSNYNTTTNVYQSIMFGVHFYNKPMYTAPVKMLSAIDTFPIYGAATSSNNYTTKDISMNGFITGYTYNGDADTVQTTLFNNTILTHTDTTVDENIPLVKRFYYSSEAGVFGTYTGLEPTFASDYPYQYVEIPGYSGTLEVEDGYGDAYSTDIVGNIGLNLNSSIFTNPHYIDSQATSASDDYLNISLTNGSTSVYYVYRWNGHNHPLDYLNSDDQFTTMPTWFVNALPVSTATCPEFVVKTSSSKINIGQYVDATHTNDKFFIISDSGNSRAYTPVLEVTMPRAIRSFTYVGSSTKVENIIYITERLRPETTSPEADVRNLYYLSNYDFTIDFKTYNTETGESDTTNTMSVSHDDVEFVRIRVHDEWQESGTTVTWDFTANAMKITISDDIAAWEHPYAVDITGISKLCAEQTNVTVEELTT